MILRFRHPGLERFFTTGSAAQIQPAHRRRLKLILTALNTAQGPRDMGLPGLDLHPLNSPWCKWFWREPLQLAERLAATVYRNQQH